MKISYNWLQTYFKNSLPEPNDLAKKITAHAYQVEAIEDLGGDYVFDIDILPHRSHDSLSYLGVAREVATILDLELSLPDLSFAGSDSVKTQDYITLLVETPKLVRRASKRFVEDVKVGPSPSWLVERLASMGQRSINNIVDITNFVMFETGQPVHAFDYDKLSGNEIKQITIRHASEGEKVTTLDGLDHTLDGSMLVIADNEKALDIAGVKGGFVSGIDDSTKRIVLSVCNFNPTNIRKTRTKLKLVTDASKRFEQEITPELVGIAMSRLTQLVSEICGGRVAEDVIDFYPQKSSRYVGGFSSGEVNNLLGTKIEDNNIEQILDRMKKHAGFDWHKVSPVEEIVKITKELIGKEYKYGASISYDSPNYFDCSSFSAYLYSRVGIQIPRITIDQYLFSEEVAQSALLPGDLVFSRNGDMGDELSFTDIASGSTVIQKSIHSSSKEFMPKTEVPGGISHVGIYIGDGKVVHASKKAGSVVLEDLATSDRFKDGLSYRTILNTDFFSRGDRYVVTIPHERLDLRARGPFLTGGIKEELIEEIGRLYGYENIDAVVSSTGVTPKANKEFYYKTLISGFLVEKGFSEIFTYALVDAGEIELQNSMSENRKFLRANIKDVMKEKITLNSRNSDLLGLEQIKIFQFGKVFRDGGEALSLCIGLEQKKNGHKVQQIIDDLLVFLGLPKDTHNYFDIKDETVELSIDELLNHLPNIDTPVPDNMVEFFNAKYEPFSPYPFIVRDVAVWVSGSTPSEDLMEILVAESGELLATKPRLFDEFKKGDRTSYGYRLIFQSKDRTLTDDEVNEIMDRIYSRVKERGWEVR